MKFRKVLAGVLTAAMTACCLPATSQVAAAAEDYYTEIPVDESQIRFYKSDGSLCISIYSMFDSNYSNAINPDDFRDAYAFTISFTVTGLDAISGASGVATVFYYDEGSPNGEAWTLSSVWLGDYDQDGNLTFASFDHDGTYTFNSHPLDLICGQPAYKCKELVVEIYYLNSYLDFNSDGTYDNNGSIVISDVKVAVNKSGFFPDYEGGYGDLTDGDYKFECLDNGTIAITEYIGAGGDVVIPSEIRGFPVTEINGFRSWRSDPNVHITSIVIPDSVTTLGSNAFSDCSDIVSITLPDSITTIGGVAFYGCTSLESIIIPDSVTSIGRNAFAHCVSLTSIDIPDSVTSTGEFAFNGCHNLVSITLPDSIRTIDEGTFYDCTSLESITIPDSVTSIGSYAFRSCESLTSIDIPDNVTSIGSYAFAECESLTSIDIPDSITSIDVGTFSNCTSLKSFAIPDSVTSIGSFAFASCESLTSIDIPDSVTSIEAFAFNGCNNLVSFTISDSVTSIGAYAFNGCLNLVSFTIPDSITTIADGTFNYCWSLESIIIPESVTSISETAFGWLVFMDENGNYLEQPEYIYLENLTIYGYTGSYAETYANTMGFGFKSLDSDETTEPEESEPETEASPTEPGTTEPAATNAPQITYPEASALPLLNLSSPKSLKPKQPPPLLHQTLLLLLRKWLT